MVLGVEMPDIAVYILLFPGFIFGIFYRKKNDGKTENETPTIKFKSFHYIIERFYCESYFVNSFYLL